MRSTVPHPLRRAWLLLAPLYLLGWVNTQAEEADETLEEVVIQAHEPRYVAPTRRDRIGRVWVPVMINEQGPYRLVLDSGATHSAVTAKVAHALGLSLTKYPPVLLRGVTGTAVTPSIRVSSLSVGELLVGSSVLPIVDDAFGGAEGLLGTEGLGDKRIYIDFINDFINISRSRNRGPSLGFTGIPLQRNPAGLLAVRARVGGVKVRAIIDTGAQASVGNLALREAITRQWMKHKQSEDIITGATGASQTGQGMSIRTIELGELRIETAHVTFGDMDIFEHWQLMHEPAILIGMDLLGLVDTLVIDYRRQELQIRPRAGGAPAISYPFR